MILLSCWRALFGPHDTKICYHLSCRACQSNGKITVGSFLGFCFETSIWECFCSSQVNRTECPGNLFSRKVIGVDNSNLCIDPVNFCCSSGLSCAETDGSIRSNATARVKQKGRLKTHGDSRQFWCLPSHC